MEDNRVLFAKLMKTMVGPNGFEPSTSSVSRKRSGPTELRAYREYETGWFPAWFSRRSADSLARYSFPARDSNPKPQLALANASAFAETRRCKSEAFIRMQHCSNS